MTGTNIYIYDTGVINATSETPYDAFAAASVASKRKGEFKVADTLKLKITSLNTGISNTNQSASNGLLSSNQRIGTAPFSFSVTGYLMKPTVYTGIDSKDLPDMFDLNMMTLSQGYKEIYIEENALLNKELLSIYQYIKGFGTDDVLNPEDERAIKVNIDSISFNEGTADLSYNITFNVDWDFE